MELGKAAQVEFVCVCVARNLDNNERLDDDATIITVVIISAVVAVYYFDLSDSNRHLSSK